MKERQIVVINGERYKVANMTKFVEKSSYWIEYKLQNLVNQKWYYLNVELTQKATLYEILNEREIDLKFDIVFQGEEFSLYEKGQGIVETYYGMTGVAVGDTDEYYEYESKTTDHILSIEKWNSRTEISIGNLVKRANIKVLDEFDE